MRVKEIMKRDVRTITPDRPLSEAASQMRIRGIRHLVVTERSAPIGVISNRDLVGITNRELELVKVRDVMATHLFTIASEATIAQAANRMRAHQVGCLPVVDEGKLAGIITTTDLLEQLGKSGHQERMTMRDRGPRRKATHI